MNRLIRITLRDILIIVFVGTILYIIDVKSSPHLYKNCQSLRDQTVLYFHHIINAFAYIGWLSNSKIILGIYLTTILLVVVRWSYNNNKCFMTQHVNEMCNIPKDNAMNDLFANIGVKKVPYIYLFSLIWLYTLFKFFNSF